MHKGSLLHLLDLEPEKELQFSHHRHLEFFSHVHIHLNIRISSPRLRRKRVLSTLPISNPLLNKNPLILPYHALGAYFSPYKAFISLNTRWGNSTL
jgi:hypothetical protein